jgi:internalin A
MMLALVLVIGCGLSWMVHLAHVERDAVAAIQKIGGTVHYDWESQVRSPNPPPNPWWPRWLADRTGLDFESHVVSVNLSKRESDAALVQFGQLKRLVNLNLNQSDVTDASLSHLKGLTSLRGLWLDNNRTTDAGLAHLSGLTNLQGLYLGRTGVTDTGLAYL